MAHLTAARAPAAGPFPPALRRSIGVIMIGSALSFLDSTIVNVALRSLSVTLTPRWRRSSGWSPATCWRSRR